MMNDYLEHYARGSEKPNHRYSGRKFQNGKWVYTYNIKNAVRKAKRASSDGGVKRKRTNPVTNFFNGTHENVLTSRKKQDQRLASVSDRIVKSGYAWIVNKLSSLVNKIKER